MCGSRMYITHIKCNPRTPKIVSKVQVGKISTLFVFLLNEGDDCISNMGTLFEFCTIVVKPRIVKLFTECQVKQKSSLGQTIIRRLDSKERVFVSG